MKSCDVVVPGKDLKCTIKVGKHRHDRSIAIASRRRYNKAIHEIAKMLARWRCSGKVRKSEAVIIVEGFGAVDVKVTRNIQKLGRRIRVALHEQNIPAHT